MVARGWLESKDGLFPNVDARRQAGRFFGSMLFFPFVFSFVVTAAELGECNVDARSSGGDPAQCR